MSYAVVFIPQIKARGQLLEYKKQLDKKNYIIKKISCPVTLDHHRSEYVDVNDGRGRLV